MTTAGNNTAQHVRTTEQLGGKLNMTPAELLANSGSADRLPIGAQQLVTKDVYTALGSPCLHLGNARGAATTQPKVTANANRANVDQTRYQREKSNMVKRRNLRRKGNGHHCIDPGLSQGM